MSGQVEFGAKHLTHKSTGEERWIPEIYIWGPDGQQITFTADVHFLDHEAIEGFTHALFRILTGKKENVRYYPGGTGGNDSVGLN